MTNLAYCYAEMDYLTDLNDEQRLAVAHTGPPLLILAGAGSGKTRVITSKITYLISELRVSPAAILAVTFTNKAAGEMSARVNSFFSEPHTVMIRTFHSFGAWLLRKYGNNLGLSPYFSIIDEDDKFAVLKKLFKEDYDRDSIKLFSHLLSRAKEQCLFPDGNLAAVTHMKDFSAVYQMYQDFLQQTGNVDFGDLILLAVRLLEQNAQVRGWVNHRFRYILVDEYQDSNLAQFKLLKALYTEGSYICVVGDEDQSIYKFRGADITNILSFTEVFPDAQVVRLEENYRSTRTILSAANKVVENNLKRLGKNLWTKNEQGEPIQLNELNDEEDEARWALSVTRELREASPRSSLAVLYRNNSQSRNFETIFTKYGIPYVLVGGVRFFEREEVKNALAYLGLLLNPQNNVYLERVINTPARGIGPKTLQRIYAQPGSNLLERCRALYDGSRGKLKQALGGFIELCESLSAALAAKPLSELVSLMLFTSGLRESYKLRDEAEGTDRVQNLEELVNACAGYPLGPDGLALFLESLLLNSQPKEAREDENPVKLITVHNTKGLEFDAVVITGLEDGLFPYFRESEWDRDIEEERRLFYVAMTRAKKRLFLSYCRQRRVFGLVRDCTPSRFLREIPDQLLTRTVAQSADDFPAYAPGQGVFHGDYGSGIILSKWDSGPNTTVEVRFDSGQRARFLLKYAQLERIMANEF